MKLLERNYCVYSKKKDLELLYSFEHFPVFMGAVDSPEEKDVFTKMSWWISRETGSIQLDPLIPLDILYSQQHVDSIGKTMFEHHKEFARFILKYKPRHIFEVGGGHGKLARNYLKNYPDASWQMLEPNPRIVDGVSIDVIEGFFDSTFNNTWNYDAFVHSHVFEHLYEPDEFMDKVSDFVGEGGLNIFSVPNMIPQLETNYLSTLDFEHTFFLSENFIDYLLSKYGFEILEKKYFKGNHSIFYATKRCSSVKITELPKCYEINKKLFKSYINHYLDVVNDLNKKVKNADGEVFLFGAHIFSQYLLAFGLHPDNIVTVLDNSETKQLRRLYGTNFIVESPRILKGKGKVYVILKAGMYNEEIKTDILNNINSKVVFLE